MKTKTLCMILIQTCKITFVPSSVRILTRYFTFYFRHFDNTFTNPFPSVSFRARPKKTTASEKVRNGCFLHPSHPIQSYTEESDENSCEIPIAFIDYVRYSIRCPPNVPHCSCVRFYLYDRRLSGVHPFFHQLRDQQADLTNNNHTGKHNRHQNTCVQHF